jgi:hypothetical protein
LKSLLLSQSALFAKIDATTWGGCVLEGICSATAMAEPRAPTSRAASRCRGLTRIIDLSSLGFVLPFRQDALGALRRSGILETMTKKPTQPRRSGKRKAVQRSTRRARIGQIFTGDQALHELFREQAAAVLDNAEIDEEEKQSILTAMTCPCCGAGTMSASVRLRPKFIAEES